MPSTSYNHNPSTSLPTRWDVFLSFRGTDTRYTFTDYLYNSLQRTGIRTFRDDPELCRGEVISDALIKAIHESKSYVVVLSENYASSRCCLDELAEILNCYETKKRLVIPVFYNIDPSVVGHQTGSFNEAFKKHETRFDRNRLEKWRFMLTKVGNLSGYQVCKNMSQADIINKVVDQILLEINPLTLEVAKYPVGLDSRIQYITTLLSSHAEGVIKIGLHGMGGVGKTTLAKAVYNQNYYRFQGSCFLANVREVSGTEKGLVCLQQQLINDVLKCKNIHIDNVDQGIVLIRDRICATKVLIVIDDLDDPKPLEFLEGSFPSGSIIIITTRNEDLLDSIKVKTKYKVNELSDAESRELFTQHAFTDDKISGTFTDLSEEILERAGGLPLALKVFGSNLLNQSEEGWRWFIHKLKRVSIDDVERKLVVSFNALKIVDPMLQDIFLDIACFFIRRKIKEVVKIMETFYTFVNHNIDILKKRCLLTINDRDQLGMHDLLQDMGREIARNHSPGEHGKHSRLWVSKDIHDVLKNQKGTETIEVIIPADFYYQDALRGISYATETFKRMRKLRFLYLKNANITGRFEQTFEDLRLLNWDCCPLKYLPSEFYPQKLVILELPRSNMRTLWELNRASQVFHKLKTLNMSQSLYLVTTPDFTTFPCLETLNLKDCTGLEDVHISIRNLASLVSLNLHGCLNLKSLGDNICNLRALEVLRIGNCKRLKALPIELGNIESLIELNAAGLTISEIPLSIGRLSNLVELDLSYNKNLKTLPDTICNLRALEVLSIGNCRSLEALPIELGNNKALIKLNAVGLTISELPVSIGRLSKLVELNLSYNKNLKTLPDTFCNLRELEVLSIGNCRSLEALPTELGNNKSLLKLNAVGLTISELPVSTGRLSKLVELDLSYNENLETLPDTICDLRCLEVLNIEGCIGLKALPTEVGKISSLIKINAEGLTVSKFPDSIGCLSKLVELKLSHIYLETLPDTICSLTALQFLSINYCKSLKALPTEFGNIESLKKLKAGGLTVSKLPDSIGRLSKLDELDLSYNNYLETLPDTIWGLSSLKTLDITSCKKLEILPDQLWKISTLNYLDASGATLLKKLPDIVPIHIALSLQILNVSESVITALPSGISQLLNLENLIIKDCCHLLSITELPPNLKWIRAKGCSSMLRLVNLSNLKQLEVLDLTNCSSLREIQGLKELTSLRQLFVEGCNSSFLAYTFTKPIIQDSPGHLIPDWICNVK